MSNVIDFKSITDIKELRRHCEAQHNTITKLSEENKLLQVEVNHLQSLLQSLPSVGSVTPQPQYKVQIDESMPEEVQAALKQVAVLNELASSRTLDFQQTKQLSEYHKILSAWREESEKKAKKQEDTMAQLTEEELLNLLDS